MALAMAAEQSIEAKQGTLIRQKKRIVTLKKPFRYNERMRGRQTNYHRSTVSSLDEFAIIGTSENPNGNWKPIPYAHYTAEAAANVKNRPALVAGNGNGDGDGDGGKPAVINSVTNGDSGHIERANKNRESEISTAASLPEHVSSEQFEDYALLHYYIPFDQFVAHQTPKPIMETLQDIPPKTISIEQLMKAAIEPVPIFRLETTSTTTTAAPSTTAKTEPPTSTVITVFPPETAKKSEVRVHLWGYTYEIHS